MSEPTSFDHILTVMGALVPLASALASIVNHQVRGAVEAGEAPSKKLLALGSMLNAASVNVDKAVQLAKMFKSAPAAVAVDAAPAEPAVCPTCGK